MSITITVTPKSMFCGQGVRHVAKQFSASPIKVNNRKIPKWYRLKPGDVLYLRKY